MKFEIKSWWSGSVLFSIETDSWKLAVEAAVKSGADLSGANLSGANLRSANLSGADLSGANLSGANLSGADLSGANLSGANLRSANLSGADLSGANLSGANLSGADLSGADLRSADLSGANLRSADLSGANLRSADLDNAYLDTGERFGEYIKQVVPALLTAGGKQLLEVANETHWSCHDWNNCPMAAAFSVTRIDKIPLLYRPRAEQFVRLFDAGLIPLERIVPAVPAEATEKQVSQ
jgi:hypothetical protein